MNYKPLLALVFFVALVGTADAQTTAWDYDAAHSTVGFSVRHLGISRIKGHFTDVKTKIQADGKTGKLTAVEATVGVKSVYTDNDTRDEHLRAEDFFNAAKYPEMKLSAKKIKWSGKKISGTADLTIKGITRKVKFNGEYLGAQKVNFGQGDQLRAGYSVEAKIKRSDFGLSFSAMAEGVSIVSDTVKIQLDVEISRNL